MKVDPFEAGFLHWPGEPTGDGLVLTHGAGSTCNAALLVAVANEFANAGFLVYRYDLPFRRKRPSGPPFPAAAEADRAGVRTAIQAVRSLVSGRIIAGGHSYGGRQTSMAAADDAALAAGLLLLSYPLHPPKRPEQLRTAHFPQLTMPVVFVHGAKDPFGTELELRDALTRIPARSDLLMVEGAGHDLKRSLVWLVPMIRERAQQFLLQPTL